MFSMPCLGSIPAMCVCVCVYMGLKIKRNPKYTFRCPRRRSADLHLYMWTANLTTYEIVYNETEA